MHYLCIRFQETNWRVGRVIDRAGLEIRYTPFGYRGFESLTLRTERNKVSKSFGTLFIYILLRNQRTTSVNSGLAPASLPMVT